MEDNPRIGVKVALAWAVNAKNCLQNLSGFSPYQLVFGKSPDLPKVLSDEPPALESRIGIEMFAKYLKALHTARRDFIRSEACECVRRELRHKIRAASQKFSIIISVKVLLNGEVTGCYRTGHPSCVYKTQGNFKTCFCSQKHPLKFKILISMKRTGFG